MARSINLSGSNLSLSESFSDRSGAAGVLLLDIVSARTVRACATAWIDFSRWDGGEEKKGTQS